MNDVSKQQSLLEDHTNFMIKVSQTLEDMQVEAKFIISNKSRENDAYMREIDRM